MHLATVIELASYRSPQAEAIIDGTKRLTYEQWNHRINSVAWGFVKLGLQSGERIAICARNSELVITAYFAAHKAGLTVVLLSPRWKSEELAYALTDANILLVLYDETASEEMINALKVCRHDIINIHFHDQRCRLNDIFFNDLFDNPHDYPPEITRDDNAIGTILYTSGTVGKPKGVQRTHSSDYYASLALIIQHRWTPFERAFGVMPFYHTMGLHCLLSMVILNGLSVILPHFDVKACIKAIENEHLTALYLVPTIFFDLTQQLSDRSERLTSIKKLAFAGAPMSSSLIKRCLETFDPEVFVNHYGGTEMHAITINPDLKNKPASSGRPALHSQIRIVTADTERRVRPCEEVAPGEIGEIIVKADSPQAFTGYLNRPDANDRALREGWYFTGDLGYLDQEGDLFLKGRIDDMIIAGGENIYPQEVERVLIAHPQVSDAAVVGFSDERWGEKIVAFIVAKTEKLNYKDLEKFCLNSPNLPRFMRPKQFIYVEEIPKSPSGKILRSKLREGLLKPI